MQVGRIQPSCFDACKALPSVGFCAEELYSRFCEDVFPDFAGADDAELLIRVDALQTGAYARFEDAGDGLTGCLDYWFFF